MKTFGKILFFASAAFACANAVLAYQNPGAPKGFVNDFANVIPAAQRTALESKLSIFEKTTGNEIAVATVPSLGGDTVDNFAVKLFEDWGIGKKGADNGILILVAPNDREARIEVGYGLEPTVTDADASIIIRTVMLPAFKNGDYYAGVDGATDKIIGLIKNDPQAVKFIEENSAPQSVPPFVPVIILIILIILLSTRGGRRVLFYMFISGFFRGGRGGNNDRFGGGGFGGFGGGRSGGGGASGSW
ncbi:MAG TPA: TPM domain-containing protein [Candidatus Paceibacterota bacterium]|nr:TPM domain-containing protein [Candidatus Paceibacterota bacterium]